MYSSGRKGFTFAAVSALVLGTMVSLGALYKLSSNSEPHEQTTRPAMSTEAQLATAALETLRGARSLRAEEAATKLRDFMQSIGSPVPESPRLSDASAALNVLITSLEENGSATDDAWEHAIETMLSLAQETG